MINQNLGSREPGAPRTNPDGRSSPGSLSEHVAAAVRPRPVHDLLSEHCLEAVVRVAECLPGALSEAWGFESRLGEDEPWADFLVCVSAEHGAREILAGTTSPSQFDSLCDDNPVWRRVRDYATRWAEPGSPIHTCVRNAWFEFDLDRSIAALPSPSVFLGTDALRGEASADQAFVPGWLLEAMSLISGRSLDTSLHDSLTRCIGALEADSRIFQLGMMLARPGAGIRLCIRGLQPRQIPTYLSVIGWPGQIDDVGKALEICVEADHVDLDIDLLPEIGLKIGLECHFETGLPNRWDALLERLERLGLCVPAKRIALRDWTAILHERTDPASWPADLRAESESRGTGTASVFLRVPHHVKLVCEPGRQLHAKAYFGVRSGWLTAHAVHQILSAQGLALVSALVTDDDRGANRRREPK